MSYNSNSSSASSLASGEFNSLIGVFDSDMTKTDPKKELELHPRRMEAL